MTSHSSHGLDVLKRSPLDVTSPEPQTPRSSFQPVSWVPSRFNVRARTVDGKLILWNTYHATLSVFEPEQAEGIETLLSQKGFEAHREGVVEYLAKRKYIIPRGTDEFRRFEFDFGRQQYRSDVLELILLSSEDCNFRCTYCYEKFPRGTMLPWVRKGIKNFVRERCSSLRLLNVSWFGGEPLYGLDAIDDLGPFFHRIAEENSIRLVSGMTTNGYLLTPEVADKLLGWGINRFQVTIDGPPENHDRNRPARDGSKTFDTILSNLRELKKRSDEFRMSIRLNFDKNNYPNLGQFFEIVETEFWGDSRFKLRFRPVGKWGGANDGQLAVCGQDERSEIYLELKNEAVRRGLSLVEDDDLRKLQGMRAPLVCYAARPYNYVIGASGKVMKCTVALDYEENNVVGKITEEGRFEFDEDKLAAWTEPAFVNDSKCRKCLVLPICNGISCPRYRIGADKPPCLPLRTNLKKELRAVVKVATSTARRVPVGASSRDAGATGDRARPNGRTVDRDLRGPDLERRSA